MTSRPTSSISIDLDDYRYGQPGPSCSLSIGVTRHLPRGVRKEDYAARNYFDVWLPLLAPSRALLANYMQGRMTFRQFASKYRAEMGAPAPRQAIRLLAATARLQPVRVGCFCADASHCHRSLLTGLIEAAAAELPAISVKSGEFSSPACALPEIED